MLSKNERHVLEHSTGWRSRTPLYRNHFCASEGHDDWPTLMALCERGLMRNRHRPAGELAGGDDVFHVTDEGVAALKGGK